MVILHDQLYSESPDITMHVPAQHTVPTLSTSFRQSQPPTFSVNTDIHRTYITGYAKCKVNRIWGIKCVLMQGLAVSAYGNLRYIRGNH